MRNLDLEPADWIDPDLNVNAAPASETRATDAPSLDRRGLLRGLAGGLVLGTSGLMLPDWLIEEAAAREGSRDGELGGRHDNNTRGGNDQRRRRRERRREQDRRQDERQDGANQDKPPGNFITLDGIKFNVEIAGAHPVKVDYFYMTNTRNGRPWMRGQSNTLSPGTSATLDSESDCCALWINDRYWVEAESRFGFGSPATVIMGYNGSIAANPIKWRGGTTAFNEQMDVGRSTIPMVIDGFSTQVTRLANEKPYAVFKVVLSAPA